MTRTPAKRLAKRKNPLSEVERLLALDKRESAARLKAKTAASKKQWGPRWRDMVRTGRVFTRVERIEPVTAAAEVTFVIRPEPGWEWRCQNCKTYSLIRPSDMPRVLSEWEALAANAVKGGFKPPRKPTIETAGCPNCKYRPGDPE